MKRLKKRFNIHLGKSHWMPMDNEWFLIPSISFHLDKGEECFEDWYHVTSYTVVITFAFLKLHIFLTLQYFTKWFSLDGLPF